MQQKNGARRGLRLRSLVLALLFAFAFTGYVQRTGVAIAAERMMPELGLTQIEVGWLLTAFLLAYSVFQLPGALVGEWLGARRTFTAIGLATVLASVQSKLVPLGNGLHQIHRPANNLRANLAAPLQISPQRVLPRGHRETGGPEYCPLMIFVKPEA